MRLRMNKRYIIRSNIICLEYSEKKWKNGKLIFAAKALLDENIIQKGFA